MTTTYLFPAAVAVAALILASSVHRTLPPRAAAFALTGALVARVAATVWSVAMLGLDFLIDHSAWCREALDGHVHVPGAIGVGALGIVGWGAIGGVRATSRHRRARQSTAVDGDLFILETEAPLAYAVPGKHPHVVVSEGMLSLLEPDEQRAMIAHEFAHLRHHHHRFVAVSDLAASLFPPLRAVARQVRLTTERWADRDAAAEVGDPVVVARSIARAAIGRTEPARGVLAMTGSDVAVRISELVSPGPVTRSVGPASLAIVALMVVSVVATALQFHHVVDFVRTFCLP